MLFVAKHLERIGDYVTDICELTVYMAEAPSSSTNATSWKLLELMSKRALIIEDDPDIAETFGTTLALKVLLLG